MKARQKRNPSRSASRPLKISVKCFYENHTPDAARIRRGIESILSHEGRLFSGQLTVCFVDDQLIRDLNRRYLDIEGTTDVLSFNYGTKAKTLAADIVVCVDEAVRNAKEYTTTLENELHLYVAHGLLHLLGYDDKSPRDEKLMRSKEQQYLPFFQLSK